MTRYHRLGLLTIVAALLVGCADTPKQTIQTTRAGAYSTALSPNGELALIGSINDGASLWRIADAERLYDWNHAAEARSDMTAATISTDSLYALTAETNRFVLWDIRSGQSLGFWPTQADILAVALSGGGQYAVVGLRDSEAIVMDTRSGSMVAQLSHPDAVTHVAVSNSGEIVATGCKDGIVRVWNLSNEKLQFAYQLGDEVSALALDTRGETLFASRYYGKGHIWETATGKMLTTIGHSRTTMTAGQFSANSRQLLTGFTTRRVILWNVASGAVSAEWRADPPFFWRPSGLVVSAVSLNANGEAITTFSNGSIYQWQKP